MSSTRCFRGSVPYLFATQKNIHKFKSTDISLRCCYCACAVVVVPANRLKTIKILKILMYKNAHDVSGLKSARICMCIFIVCVASSCAMILQICKGMHRGALASAENFLFLFTADYVYNVSTILNRKKSFFVMMMMMLKAVCIERKTRAIINREDARARVRLRVQRRNQ